MEVNHHDFLAGCIGGIAGVLVGHPFDTVKVRLQRQSFSNRVYKGSFDCFRAIIVKESSLGLYKGVSSPLVSLPFINAVMFGVQGNVNKSLTHDNQIFNHTLAGGIAGFAQSFITAPTELIKTQMQIQGEGKHHGYVSSYNNSWDCARKIVKYRGFTGLGRGLTATICRESPSCAIYFATYEIMCHQFKPEYHQHTPTWGLLLAGGMAGCMSWIFSYPVDVVKTRYQSDCRIRNGLVEQKYVSYRHCIKMMIAEGGYGVLWQGLGVTMLRAFPVNAAIFTAVSLSLRFWEQKDNGTLEIAGSQSLH